MVASDSLYKINQRLQEIFVSEDYFAGLLVLFVGAVLQLRPVKAPYIFQRPRSRRYRPLHSIDPLWESFDVVVLSTNHRQGKESDWATRLNRFRIGEVTDDDVRALETRKMRHYQGKDFSKACHCFYTNKEVDAHNAKILNSLPGKLYQTSAICNYPKGYRPSITDYGTIDDTNFKDVLQFKLGSKVMVIFNVNIGDSLTNGSLGRVISVVMEHDKIKAIIVQFDDHEAGNEQRETNKEFLLKHGIQNGTPIFQSTLEYQLPFKKSAKHHACKGKITQFPLKLADASTCHKLQGITIAKGTDLVIHGHSRLPPAMAYVMMGRVASFENLYLDDNFDYSQIKPNQIALEENNCLNEESIVEDVTNQHFDLFVVNVRSLSRHIEDLKKDFFAERSNFIAVVETWL